MRENGPTDDDNSGVVHLFGTALVLLTLPGASFMVNATLGIIVTVICLLLLGAFTMHALGGDPTEPPLPGRLDAGKRGSVQVRDYSWLVGVRGRTETVLRPEGTVVVRGERIPASGVDGYVAAETDVEIVSADRNRVVVRIVADDRSEGPANEVGDAAG